MPPKKSSNGSANRGAAENKTNRSSTAFEQSGAADLTKKAKRSDNAVNSAKSTKDAQKSAPKSSRKSTSSSAKAASSSTKSTPSSAKAASSSTKKSSKAEKVKSNKPAKSVEKEKSASKPMVALKKSGAVSKKYHKKPSDDSGISCKTPQVMKLVAEDNGENAVIAAGKSRIPARLKGREPLSKMVKREMHGDIYEPSEVEVVNLTELAVKYEAPQILDRFNACSCEKCVAVFSEMVLKKLPARFARITKTKLGIRSRELNGRVEPVREMVQITMIRELIRSRKRIFHDE